MPPEEDLDYHRASVSADPTWTSPDAPKPALSFDDDPPPRALFRPFAAAATLAALLGATFSAVSTSDFMQFLDRQVHSIHCSFVPGAGREIGESGCRTVMMSPYSSFFRESVWGGVPVSLWALAVFAYLAFFAGSMTWKGTPTRAQAGYLVLATGLPLGMSAIYFGLSMHVGATCKVCVGMYASSVAAFLLAALALRQVPHESEGQPSHYGRWFLLGVTFVGVLTGVYFMARPPSDVSKTGGCGTLVQQEDPSSVMIELHAGKTDAVEVLDPLCPSCKAFDTRLAASDLSHDLGLKGLLFPLDSTCNWMVTEELHPGACAVSEAILCAAGLGEQKDHAAARAVLAWAFKNQERLREDAKKDQKAMRAELEEKFPAVKGCLGGPQVKNKLIKSLRWTVANALPVLTPQLFVRGKRMCDEDTDLGLEYSLKKMLAAKGASK